MNLKDIKPNPNNPRVIKDDKFHKLVKSIQEFPKMLELRPMVVNEHNILLGGNMRLKALQHLGYTDIPETWVRKASELTEDEQRQFIIKDNVGFGEWDWDMLANEWDADELDEWGLDVPDFGKQIQAEEDDYEIPDEVKTDIVIGDIFEIGDHRLMCGDSTDSDAVGKLVDGKKANMSFTNPPYNVGKSAKLSGNTFTNDNKYASYDDNKKQNEYLELLLAFTKNALLYSEYLICNIQSLAENKIAIIEYLNAYKQNFIDVAIWDKGHGAPQMAKNVMNSAWEYLFFISSNENPSRSIPNAQFHGTVANIYRGTSQKNNEYSSIHAATFPVDLPEWALQFTKENDIILDQFLGTGTTMVAAHQLNRKCYGMELDPKYCQVILERMLMLDPSLKVKRNGLDYEVKINN